MNVFIYIAICLFPLGLFGQGEVGRLFEDMPSDSIGKATIKTHTSLKPMIRQSNPDGKTGSYIQVTGLGDLNYFQNDNLGFKTGLGLEVSGAIKDKLHFRLAGVEGVSQSGSFYTPRTYLNDSIGKMTLYSDLRGRVSYTPNHIFNFQAGLDHNFIGEGSRSLLLSDYGTPYPFGQIRMRFWRLEYSILYQFLREWDNNRWEGKFASSHHLSFNAAKWLNLGLFETVIFQPKDTLVNRGFDVEYLNPFVFYRPQEYSLGSSDNVLIGMELTAKWKNHMFYSQFILDEFFLAEIRARSGWWASKYGGQFGVKGRLSKGKNDFFYRLEYNFVRPYTYAHLSEELNYGNQGSSLAHPYGSNFMELLLEAKWQREKWFAKLFTNYFVRGADQDGFNYGSDPYLSYVNRPYEYGHYIGQGRQFNGTKSVLTVGYQILNHGKLNAFIENHVNYTTLDNALRYTLVVGIRSLLWNDHRNY
jgi:hypothetical protein